MNCYLQSVLAYKEDEGPDSSQRVFLMHIKLLKISIIQSFFSKKKIYIYIYLLSLLSRRGRKGESDRNDFEAIKAMADCHQQSCVP